MLAVNDTYMYLFEVDPARKEEVATTCCSLRQYAKHSNCGYETPVATGAEVTPVDFARNSAHCSHLSHLKSMIDTLF